MKKIILTVLLILMLASAFAITLPASAATDFTGWTPISSADDFANITSGTSSSPNKYYLTKDITVNATINSEWGGAAITNIVLDGNGKTITVSRSLFNTVSNVTIQNLKLDGRIEWKSSPFQKSPIASGNSGSTNGKVTLTNVTSDVDMEVCFDNRYKRLSGVIYYTGSGSVLTNVKYTGSIFVTFDSDAAEEKIEDVGGLVGTAKNTTFLNCVNEGSIYIDENVSPGYTNGGAPLFGSVAGIAGESSSCVFNGCSNSGAITVESESHQYMVAGIAAKVTGDYSVINCTNSGDIVSTACTNGILGCNTQRAELSGCTNTGDIEINYVYFKAKEGTCAEEGTVEHYQCLACNSFFDAKGDQINLAELYTGYKHTMGSLIAEKNATCLSYGMKSHYCCANCGQYFDSNKEPTVEFFLRTTAGHTYKKVPASGVSCEGAETLEHYNCTVCNKYFDLSKNEVDKSSVILGEGLGHDYGELISRVEPTTAEEGMAAHYKCATCGKLFDRRKNEKTETQLKIPVLVETPEEPSEPETPNEPGEPQEPNAPETPGEPEEPNEPEAPNEPNAPNETDRPEGSEATETPEGTDKPENSTAPAEDTGEESKGGCSSMLSGTAAICLAIVLTAVSFRKKENGEA